MCDDNKKRCPNWIPSEKELLVDLVEKHIGVIGNTKLDTFSMTSKQAAWQTMSVEFNRRSDHYHRDAQALMAHWKRMKSLARMTASLARKQSISTGGRSPELNVEDPVHLRVLSLMNIISEDANNSYDSNSMDPAQAVDISMRSSTSEDSDENYVLDWGDNTPQLPKAPLPAPMKTESPSSLESLYREKIKAIELKNMLATKEAKERSTISQLDIQIRKEILKQERLKTKRLLLQLRKKKKVNPSVTLNQTSIVNGASGSPPTGSG